MDIALYAHYPHVASKGTLDFLLTDYLIIALIANIDGRLQLRLLLFIYAYWEGGGRC
jgi:hypothetical protein